jgi:hypothetical protein
MEEQQREILNQDLQPLSGPFDLPSKSELEHRGVCLGDQHLVQEFFKRA